VDDDRPRLKRLALLLTLALGAGLAHEVGYQRGRVSGTLEVLRRTDAKTDELLGVLRRQRDELDSASASTVPQI
jgi:hypothetical protein